MANIILVNPNKVIYPSPTKDFTGDEIAPPLGLISLAALLQEKGHHVEIFDSQTVDEDRSSDRYNTLAIYEEFLTECTPVPNIVGITCITPYRNIAQKYIKTTRKIFPTVTIIVGGPDATFAPEKYLIEGGADLTVHGEGEYSLLDIANGMSYDKILGITFRKNGGLISNNPRPLIKNLDDLPFPARNLIELEKYHEKMTSMITSRGCPHSCIFCASKKLWGGKLRSRSPAKVAEEIGILAKKGYHIIRHQDDNWAERGADFLKELYFELKNRGILELKLEHEIETSPISINIETIEWIKKIGVKTVWMGFETSNDKLRKYLKKPYSYSDIQNAVNILKRNDIKIGFFLIFGIPEETYSDAMNTVDDAYKLNPDYIGISILTRYPGTSLYKLEPNGRRGFEDLFQSIVGWGHSGEYIGKKMDVDPDLLNVIKYAYEKFGKRLGNWSNIVGIDVLTRDTEIDELVTIVKNQRLNQKERLDAWSTLREMRLTSQDSMKRSYLSAVLKTLNGEILKENSKFGEFVKAESDREKEEEEKRMLEKKRKEEEERRQLEEERRRKESEKRKKINKVKFIRAISKDQWLDIAGLIGAVFVAIVAYIFIAPTNQFELALKIIEFLSIVIAGIAIISFLRKIHYWIKIVNKIDNALEDRSTLYDFAHSEMDKIISLIKEHLDSNGVEYSTSKPFDFEDTPERYEYKFNRFSKDSLNCITIRITRIGFTSADLVLYKLSFEIQFKREEAIIKKISDLKDTNIRFINMDEITLKTKIVYKILIKKKYRDIFVIPDEMKMFRSTLIGILKKLY